MRKIAEFALEFICFVLLFSVFYHMFRCMLELYRCLFFSRSADSAIDCISLFNLNLYYKYFTPWPQGIGFNNTIVIIINTLMPVKWIVFPAAQQGDYHRRSPFCVTLQYSNWFVKTDRRGSTVEVPLKYSKCCCPSDWHEYSILSIRQ
jgi:hypothetical protein